MEEIHRKIIEEFKKTKLEEGVLKEIEKLKGVPGHFYEISTPNGENYIFKFDENGLVIEYIDAKGDNYEITIRKK
jgi:hypothetical protein